MSWRSCINGGLREQFAHAPLAHPQSAVVELPSAIDDVTGDQQGAFPLGALDRDLQVCRSIADGTEDRPADFNRCAQFPFNDRMSDRDGHRLANESMLAEIDLQAAK